MKHLVSHTLLTVAALVTLVLPVRGAVLSPDSLVLEPDAELFDQRMIIQAALDAMPEGRSYYARLKLRGEFPVTGAIEVDDFTVLDLSEARIVLVSDANESIIRNRAGADGNHHITIIGGILEGNRERRGAVGSSCITMLYTSHLHIEGTRASFCARDGIRVDGRGKKARNVTLKDLLLLGNMRDGLLVSWAVRDATVTNVTARHNWRYGVYSDHSESNYTTIRAENNGLDGIFIRNVFNNSYLDLRARRNGRHGINVLGMVESLGRDWQAHNNGARSDAGAAADVFFSGNHRLSYGITSRTTINGMHVGDSRWSPRGAGGSILWVEQAHARTSDYRSLRLTNVLVSGNVLLPDSDGLSVDLRMAE